MTEDEVVRTVRIPIDEYFDLKSKADSAMWLLAELGEMRTRLAEIDRRMYEIERRTSHDRP